MNLFIYLVFILVIGLTSGTPLSVVTPKPIIVGGFETSIEHNQWQVSLRYRNPYTGIISHICGGSIIGNRWVLSAAHCVIEDENTDNYSVRVGSSFHETGGSILKLKKIIANENYNKRTYDYDFSLLELAEPLDLTKDIKKISLPNADVDILAGIKALVTGWGKTLNSEESNDKLRGAYVPIVEQDICKKAYTGILPITDRMICAGDENGGKDSCQGDSGGPLSIQKDENSVLIGVVSWGKGCALPSYPGVYSRVSSVRAWINEVTGI